MHWILFLVHIICFAPKNLIGGLYALRLIQRAMFFSLSTCKNHHFVVSNLCIPIEHEHIKMAQILFKSKTRLMRILQPQTESGPRNYFFILFFIFFSCFISFSDHVKLSFSFFFHSPIMWKCHSHLFIAFPSCAVNIIMCILVPSRLVDTQRKTSKSKTQKLRPQPQFLWGRNSRLLQVRIRLTLVN